MLITTCHGSELQGEPCIPALPVACWSSTATSWNVFIRQVEAICKQPHQVARVSPQQRPQAVDRQPLRRPLGGCLGLLTLRHLRLRHHRVTSLPRRIPVLLLSQQRCQPPKASFHVVGRQAHRRVPAHAVRVVDPLRRHLQSLRRQRAERPLHLCKALVHRQRLVHRLCSASRVVRMMYPRPAVLPRRSS